MTDKEQKNQFLKHKTVIIGKNMLDNTVISSNIIKNLISSIDKQYIVFCNVLTLQNIYKKNFTNTNIVDKVLNIESIKKIYERQKLVKQYYEQEDTEKLIYSIYAKIEKHITKPDDQDILEFVVENVELFNKLPPDTLTDAEKILINNINLNPNLVIVVDTSYMKLTQFMDKCKKNAKSSGVNYFEEVFMNSNKYYITVIYNTSTLKDLEPKFISTIDYFISTDEPSFQQLKKSNLLPLDSEYIPGARYSPNGQVIESYL